MDVLLSGGDLGGTTQHFDAEPAIGAVFTVGGYNFRYDGNGQAVFTGMA